MAVGSPPTVRRRQLGRELRKLRDEAGLHIDQIAERLRCSPSRISRIETARIRISPGTVHEILDVLEVHDGRRGRLVALAREAEEPGWWQQYSDVLPYELSTYIALESEATAVRLFEPLVVHGLLQTEEYARAVLRKGLAPGAGAVTARAEPDAAKQDDAKQDEVEQMVAARMTRKAVLERPDPLRLWLLMGEAALHRMVGGRGVMRRQLEYLLELNRSAHIRIQVLPFATGALASMTGAFSIIEFAEQDAPNVVFVENVTGDIYLEQPQGVANCTELFQRLADDALDDGASIRMIEGFVSEL